MNAYFRFRYFIGSVVSSLLLILIEKGYRFLRSIHFVSTIIMRKAEKRISLTLTSEHVSSGRGCEDRVFTFLWERL